MTSVAVLGLRTLRRYAVWLCALAALLSGCEATLEAYGKATGVYSVIYVKTDAAPPDKVMRAFAYFASKEGRQCAQVVNASEPTLHCRGGAIDLMAIQESKRVKISSTIDSGYLLYSKLSPEERSKKDSKALQDAIEENKPQLTAQNARLREYLRRLFGEAVE